MSELNVHKNLEEKKKSVFPSKKKKRETEEREGEQANRVSFLIGGNHLGEVGSPFLHIRSLL